MQGLLLSVHGSSLVLGPHDVLHETEGKDGNVVLLELKLVALD